MGKVMTETEKAERRARMAERKAAQAERWAQEKQDRAIIADALRAVIIDDTATPAQRLFAVTCLNYSMGYHIVPYNLQYSDSREDADFTRLMADFAATLKAAEESTAEKESN